MFGGDFAELTTDTLGDSLPNFLPARSCCWLSSRRPAARRCWRSGLHGSSALPRPLACGRCVHHGDMWYANRRQGIVELHRWAGGQAVIDLLHLSGGALAAGRCWAGNWLGRGIPSPGPADATLCPWTAQNIVLLGCDYTSRIVAMCWLAYKWSMRLELMALNLAALQRVQIDPLLCCLCVLCAFGAFRWPDS